MVRVALLKDGCGFASSHVNSLTSGIEPHVVVEACTGQCRDDFAGIGVEDDKLGWLPCGAKQSMMRLVESDRILHVGVWHRPSGDRLACVQVDDYDLVRTGVVHIELL